MTPYDSLSAPLDPRDKLLAKEILKYKFIVLNKKELHSEVRQSFSSDHLL